MHDLRGHFVSSVLIRSNLIFLVREEILLLFENTINYFVKLHFQALIQINVAKAKNPKFKLREGQKSF